MRNAWKVGMRYVIPEFMLNEGIAYAYGDSMPDYLNHSNIASVKPGDIIIMAKSVQDGIKHIGLVQSKPMFCLDNSVELDESDFLAKGIERSEDETLIEKFSNLEDHQDIVYFKVDWLKMDTNELDVKFVNTKGFVTVKDNELLNETVEEYLSKTIKMNTYIDILKSNKNMILTGAPGTGKTFLAKEIAAQLISYPTFKTTKTNEDIDIDDFFRWINSKGRDGKNYSISYINDLKACASYFKRTFKGLDQLINEIKSNSIDAIIKGHNNSSGSRSAFLNFLIEYANETNNNSSVNFPINKNAKSQFVQFHPSYDYTDFVEGLRPVKKEGQQEIGFELKNGVFKDFCKRAVQNPDYNYVFIIDEINRGEIPKIFGELFFSIDPGYRGENGKVKTQYANIQTEDSHFSDDIEEGCFFVPENLYIIGTMNDIDRSIETFDFAIRRRFAWQEITAKESQRMLDNDEAWENMGENTEKPSKQTLEEIKNRMDSLNNEIGNNIELNLGRAYQIGAAYFLKYTLYTEDNNPFKKLWENHLKLLLQEYLRGLPNSVENMEKLTNAYNLENAATENNG